MSWTTSKTIAVLYFLRSYNHHERDAVLNNRRFFPIICCFNVLIRRFLCDDDFRLHQKTMDDSDCYVDCRFLQCNMRVSPSTVLSPRGEKFSYKKKHIGSSIFNNHRRKLTYRGFIVRFSVKTIRYSKIIYSNDK